MPSSSGTGSSVSSENGASYVLTILRPRRACNLFVAALQIWKTSWTPVKVAYLFCRYVYVAFMLLHLDRLAQPIAVGIGFLRSFPTSCMRSPSATPRRLACGSLRFVFPAMSIFDDLSLTTVTQIPVALAMWNQVSAECILLIRTYAFFNRNMYVLALLVSALAGVVAYQLYVTTSEMDRKCCTLLCAWTLSSQPRSPSFHSQCESPRWYCAMTCAYIELSSPMHPTFNLPLDLASLFQSLIQRISSVSKLSKRSRPMLIANIMHRFLCMSC